MPLNQSLKSVQSQPSVSDLKARFELESVQVSDEIQTKVARELLQDALIDGFLDETLLKRTSRAMIIDTC
jgi:hypothetical protein